MEDNNKDMQNLLSALSLRKTNRTKSFKPHYDSPEQATKELSYALQVEVESLGFKVNVDEQLNRRLSEIGRWLADDSATGLLLYGNVGSGKTTIMDAISNLSATSEEVAASSQSSIEISDDCRKDMAVTKDILHEILEISRSGNK